MSAIAPAGNASSITGRVPAAETSATIAGEGASVVISQPAPTSFIQVPMFDTSVASHTARNKRLRSGLQGERGLECIASKGRSMPRARRRIARLSVAQRVAESEGFEPPSPCGLTVFKTAAFNRSANSPGDNYRFQGLSAWDPCARPPWGPAAILGDGATWLPGEALLPV